jgi:Mn-dependent DtxR family transcriptional regulator
MPEDRPTQMPVFTDRQGQYLAFLYAYTRLNRRPPAERDFQEYFQVTAPSVHHMILTLERLGFIRRTPGAARSITLLLPPESLPNLR